MERRDPTDLLAAAKQGYTLVNSSHEDTYLDYTHEKIPLKRVDDFNPIPKDLDPIYHKYIIGFGCQMWRERVASVERLHEQTFPRIAAYAEVGWSNEN